eukprot:1936867-Prymnesium_polylepis.2
MTAQSSSLSSHSFRQSLTSELNLGKVATNSWNSCASIWLNLQSLRSSALTCAASTPNLSSASRTTLRCTTLR